MSASDIFPSKDKRDLLMTLLKVLGGHKVEVTFSGGGDSGSIEGASLLDRNGNAIDLDGATINWCERKSNFNHATNEWERTTHDVPNMPLNDVLTGLAESALDTTDLDWYNNEGGQGHLTIDLSTTPPEINLYVGINYTHTNDYNFDFSEFDDEAEETK